jgi:hypothetical protein
MTACPTPVPAMPAVPAASKGATLPPPGSVSLELTPAPPSSIPMAIVPPAPAPPPVIPFAMPVPPPPAAAPAVPGKAAPRVESTRSDELVKAGRMPARRPVVASPSEAATGPVPIAVPALAPGRQARIVVGAAVALVALVAIPVAIRLLLKEAPAAPSMSRAEATKYQDVVLTGDPAVLSACRQFTASVQAWLEGRPARVADMRSGQDEAKKAATAFASNVEALGTPPSDEGKEFQRRAREMASVYSDVAVSSFSEILGRVGEAKAADEEDRRRIQQILIAAVARIDQAESQLQKARGDFAKKYDLAPVTR